MLIDINIKKASIYRAIKWSAVLKFSKPLKKLFGILFVLFFIIFLYGFLPANLSLDTNRLLLGLSLIFLSLSLACWMIESFFDVKLKRVKTIPISDEVIAHPESYNLIDFLDFEVARAVYYTEKLTQKKNIKSNSSILLYFILKDNPELNFIFNRALLDAKGIQEVLKNSLTILEDDLTKIVLESVKIAHKRGREKTNIGDTLISLATENPVFKKILIDNKLKVRDVENLVWWLESLKKRVEQNSRWWQYDNLIRRKGFLAKEWTSGFTVNLDRFSKNWSEIMRDQSFPEVIGHDSELAQLERILSSREQGSNVLLIGEPGTGRKSIIQAFATRSFLGQSLPDINYKVVKELDLTNLFTRLQNREEIEVTLDQIFREALFAGNIVLVIDQFHNFVRGQEKTGMLDISAILSSYLMFPQFQLVAVTDFVNFHKTIEQNPPLLSLFGKVEVSEISEQEITRLLEQKALSLEAQNKIFISYPALRDVINYNERYFPNLSSPERELESLSEAVTHALSVKSSVLLSKHVAQIISQKSQTPVGEMEEKEKAVLLNLEELIHQRIINQNEAVDDVAAALRRARAEITIRKGPMGAFLFLGPTGVGKTETAKALSQIYFGSESKMIRLDMSEFQAITDIARLIGSREEEGFLTTQVRENPFSLILFDEIEKANPKILNLLLQVLDEGFLTDGLGRKTQFQDSIIVATSNAGYKIILKALEDKEPWSEVKDKMLDHIFDKGIFRPEFINRFDSVVLFKALTHENLLDIAQLMLANLQKNIKQKDIDLVITQELKEKIVKLGYNPVFGAREMRRVIQDRIENVLAEAILANKIKGGDKIKILPDSFEIEIS